MTRRTYGFFLKAADGRTSLLFRGTLTACHSYRARFYADPSNSTFSFTIRAL